ncbi:MAG: heme-binding protein [Chitinophagia bacterium]|nr:heme-binding protein [Chitinophagia bacterium]
MSKMYILLIIFSAFILFQSFMAFSTSKIEKQKYRVVKTEKEFEIRFYPPAVLATIRSSASSYRELASNGFRRIAGYIFGNNEASAKIAMTSPVRMDINQKNSSMSFVMPSQYELKDLPKPKDASVEIHESPAEYAAVIEFGGFATDEKIKKYVDQLKSVLSEKGINTIGNFKYLGYNPPYQFIGRKNEIIIAVDWKE